MKKTCLALAALFSVLLSFPLYPQVSSSDNIISDKEKKEGWRLLFDGKTSAGWMNAKSRKFPASGWEIKDGTLSLNPASKGTDGGGDIVTTSKYGSFELNIDFRYAAGTNSGIKYFVDTESENGARASIGCEFQIIDELENADAKTGLSPIQKHSALYDLIAPENVRDFGSGQWNHATIIVSGNKVQHWLNGFMTVEYVRGTQEWKQLVSKSKFRDVPGFGELAEGRILLQDHGGAISFKNIKIREIKQ